MEARGMQTQASRAAIQLGSLYYQAGNAFTKESRIPGQSAVLLKSRLGCGPHGHP